MIKMFSNNVTVKVVMDDRHKVKIERAVSIVGVVLFRASGVHG